MPLHIKRFYLRKSIISLFILLPSLVLLDVLIGWLKHNNIILFMSPGELLRGCILFISFFIFLRFYRKIGKISTLISLLILLGILGPILGLLYYQDITLYSLSIFAKIMYAPDIDHMCLRFFPHKSYLCFKPTHDQ